eukprot:gene4248-14361_t
MLAEYMYQDSSMTEQVPVDGLGPFACFGEPTRTEVDGMPFSEMATCATRNIDSTMQWLQNAANSSMMAPMLASHLTYTCGVTLSASSNLCICMHATQMTICASGNSNSTKQWLQRAANSSMMAPMLASFLTYTCGVTLSASSNLCICMHATQMTICASGNSNSTKQWLQRAANSSMMAPMLASFLTYTCGVTLSASSICGQTLELAQSDLSTEECMSPSGNAADNWSPGDRIERKSLYFLLGPTRRSVPAGSSDLRDLRAVTLWRWPLGARGARAPGAGHESFLTDFGQWSQIFDNDADNVEMVINPLCYGYVTHVSINDNGAGEAYNNVSYMSHPDGLDEGGYADFNPYLLFKVTGIRGKGSDNVKIKIMLRDDRTQCSRPDEFLPNGMLWDMCHVDSAGATFLACLTIRGPADNPNKINKRPSKGEMLLLETKNLLKHSDIAAHDLEGRETTRISRAENLITRKLEEGERMEGKAYQARYRHTDMEQLLGGSWTRGDRAPNYRGCNDTRIYGAARRNKNQQEKVEHAKACPHKCPIAFPLRKFPASEDGGEIADSTSHKPFKRSTTCHALETGKWLKESAPNLHK